MIKLLVLDFDGVLTDNHVYVNDHGEETIRAYRGDGIGIERLKALGIPVVILSAELNPVVTRRAEKLGIPSFQTKEEKREILPVIINSLFTGVNIVEILKETAYMGNDITDLECLKAVGYPGIPWDAHDFLIHYGFWKSNFKGGEGAVREFCDALAEGLVKQYGAQVH